MGEGTLGGREFMRIDGKQIAQEILNLLKKQVNQSSLHPTLAVILIGDDPASISYIKQKQKAADFIGAKIIVKKLGKNIGAKDLIKVIRNLNKDPKIHGIIVQLPLPEHLNPSLILTHILPEKDIDGFHPDSLFIPPVAMAVLKIFEKIRKQKSKNKITTRNSKILVIGRGMTAGKPIAKTLKKLGYKVSVAYSKTTQNKLVELAKSADAIISCVGRANMVKSDMVKENAIVIGVGIHREKVHLQDENRVLAGIPQAGEVNTLKEKLAGDFNEAEISKVAGFYTPTPGGIGPINVACLMENLVKASRKTLNPS